MGSLFQSPCVNRQLEKKQHMRLEKTEEADRQKCHCPKEEEGNFFFFWASAAPQPLSSLSDTHMHAHMHNE
eukprot:3767916-Rhodomonas_salina.1